MRKFQMYLLIFLIVASFVYLMGPKPPKAVLNKDLPSLPTGAGNLESYINKKEAGFDVRKDNESRIIWANADGKKRTEYVLLYLHGFSASWKEGYPANVEFARHF